MKIEFNTKVIGAHTGYGNASRLLQEALVERGVEIIPRSDVIINFCMPTEYKVRDITIGYTPWESTLVPENWVLPMLGVDSLWTTSKWCSYIFKAALSYSDEIKVIPHGIEKCWAPRPRRIDGPFTWLHVGEPAVRKGGDLVLQAWHEHFRFQKDIRLVMKCNKYPSARYKENKSIVVAPGDYFTVIGKVLTQEELIQLHYDCHAMVYPTRGEGFGLIPLQAMATGMPTIFPRMGGTQAFEEYSLTTLSNSGWVMSKEQVAHPGEWLDHSLDEIIWHMECIMNNYDFHSNYAYDMGFRIHRDYSWESVADQVVTEIQSLMTNC